LQSSKKEKNYESFKEVAKDYWKHWLFIGTCMVALYFFLPLVN